MPLAAFDGPSPKTSL